MTPGNHPSTARPKSLARSCQGLVVACRATSTPTAQQQKRLAQCERSSVPERPRFQRSKRRGNGPARQKCEQQRYELVAAHAGWYHSTKTCSWPPRETSSSATMEKPSLASPLDAHLPSAVVGTILMKYLDPENWARLRITAKGWETPAFAALLHPWRARAAELQKLVHAPAPPPSSLTETLALLQHCSLADDSKSVGVGVISRLRIDAASCARNVELRCPRRSWRPWMPLARRRVEILVSR